MPNSFGSRLQHAWNAFFNKDPTGVTIMDATGYGYSRRPDRIRLSRGNERSIITSIFNRIALDVAAINIQHVKLDENGRYLEEIRSGLNNCLTMNANIDQTSRAFVQDVVMSMLDEGCVAIVPVDTTVDPRVTGSYDIKSMRVGKIIEWYPRHVRVQVYNDNTGRKEEITLPKATVAIVENPLYAVINEPNSTFQRLVRKLSDSKKARPATEAEAKYIREVLSTASQEKLSGVDLENITLYDPVVTEDDPFGYVGRTVLMEQLVVTEDVQAFIRGDVADINTEAIEKVAKHNGMLTLEQKGVLLALKGETTLEEVSRVI